MNELTNEQKAQFVLTASKMILNDEITDISPRTWTDAKVSVSKESNCTPFNPVFSPAAYNRLVTVLNPADVEMVLAKLS